MTAPPLCSYMKTHIHERDTANRKQAQVEAAGFTEEELRSKGLNGKIVEPARTYNAFVHLHQPVDLEQTAQDCRDVAAAVTPVPKDADDLIIGGEVLHHEGSHPTLSLDAVSESDEEFYDCEEGGIKLPTAAPLAGKDVTQRGPSPKQAVHAHPEVYYASSLHKTHCRNVIFDLPPDCNLNVGVQIHVGGLHDLRTHIDLIFSLTQSVSQSAHKRYPFTFSYYARNISGPVELRLVDKNDQLDDNVRQLMRKSTFLNDTTAVLRLKCNGLESWSVNLSGGTDFGVFNEVVGKIRSCILGPHQATIILSNAASAPDLSESLNRELNNDRRNDPSLSYWSQAKTQTLKHLTYRRCGPTGLAREDRPDRARLTLPSPRLTYPNMLEFLTRQAVGVSDENTYALASKRTYIRDLSARFVRLPGDKNVNNFLMFVDTFGEPNQLSHLSAGDQVSVRIHALNPYRTVTENDWRAEYIAGFPAGRDQDMLFSIKRPYDDDMEAWMGRDPAVLHTCALKDMDRRDTAMRLLDSTPKHAVDIRYHINQRIWARQVDTIAAIQKVVAQEGGEASSPTATMLKGNRYDHLIKSDLLEDLVTCKEAFEQLKMDLRAEQQGAIDYLRQAPNRMALFAGAAGTGKTTIVHLLSGALLQKLVADHASSEVSVERQSLRALILTPINSNADRLANKSREKLRSKTSDAVVARYYSYSTNEKLARVPATAERNRRAGRTVRPYIDYESGFQELQKPSRFLFEILESKLSREFPDDARVTGEGMLHSTAQYTLIGCGVELPNPAHHPPELVARLRSIYAEGHAQAAARDFSNVYAEYKDSYNFKPSKEDLADFSDAWSEVHKIMLAHCDAVVTTNQQMMCDLGVEFQWFFMDEAARAPPADGLAFIWHRNCRGYIFVGDPMQSTPNPDAPRLYSPCFADQELPPFSRLLMSGFPHYHMSVQHRYSAEICGFISDTFYDSLLNTDASVANRQGVKKCAETFKTVFGLQECVNLVLVDVPDTQETIVSTTGSKYNTKCAIAAWNIVKSLLATDDFKPNDIMIVVQYSASSHLHDTVKLNVPGAQDVRVTTNLKSQGAEAAVVIYIIDSAQKMGFAAESNRVCGGLTRATDGLIVVHDSGSLSNIDEWLETPFGKALEREKHAGKLVSFPSQICREVGSAVTSLGRRKDNTRAKDIVHDQMALLSSSNSAR